MRRICLALCLTVALLAASEITQAAVIAIVWTRGYAQSQWDTLAAWNDATSAANRVPLSTDDAAIGDATIPAGMSAVTVANLYVGWRGDKIGGASGNYDNGTLLIDATSSSDQRLTVTGAMIMAYGSSASSSNGTVTQNSGRVTVGTLDFSTVAGPTATYNLVGGALTTTGNMNFGIFSGGITSTTTGTSHFVQTGGTVNIGGDLWVSRGGNDTIPAGRDYSISDGTLNVTGNLTVGGCFRFIQTGGDVTIGGDVTLSTQNRLNTAVDISDGTLTIGGSLDMDNSYPTAFTISGDGIVRAADFLIGGHAGNLMTISDNGMLQVRQANYSVADAVADLGNNRILGAGLGVTTVNVGGVDYTQVAVPEPATLGLLALGGAMLLARRRRAG